MAEVAQLPSQYFAVANDGLKSPFIKTSDVNISLPVKEIEPRTIDELMRSRARHFPDEKILGYPDEKGEYVEYTYCDLDTFACQAAQQYLKTIPRRASSNEKERVVGLLGASNLDYLITTLALTKLGFTVLFLSTRISGAAYQSLLENTSSQHILVDDSFLETAKNLKAGIPGLSITKIVTVCSLSQSTTLDASETRLDSILDLNIESKKISWIIHSSGSTGLPKPIYQTHTAALRK